jgi:hypothetical protein
MVNEVSFWKHFSAMVCFSSTLYIQSAFDFMNCGVKCSERMFYLHIWCRSSKHRADSQVVTVHLSKTFPLGTLWYVFLCRITDQPPPAVNNMFFPHLLKRYESLFLLK